MPSGRHTSAADFLKAASDDALCLPTITELKKRLRSKEFTMPEREISKVVVARRRARNRVFSQKSRDVSRIMLDKLAAKTSAYRKEIDLLKALLAAEVAENLVLWEEIGLQRTAEIETQNCEVPCYSGC